MTNPGEYKAIWDVLNALIEQDSDLADVVSKLYSKLGGGLEIEENRPAYDPLFKFMHVDAAIELRDLISVRILDKLSYDRESYWNHQYNALIAYKADHGHYIVAKNINLSLFNWLRNIRRWYLQNKLPQRWVDKLTAIEVPLNEPRGNGDDCWNEFYQKLLDYKQSVGNPETINVPRTGNISLAKWCCRQRSPKILDQNKIDRLNAIGFEWEPLENLWNRKYEDFKKYYKKEINMTTELKAWLGHQRKSYKAGRLTEDKQNKLIALDFILAPEKFSFVRDGIDKHRLFNKALTLYKATNKWSAGRGDTQIRTFLTLIRTAYKNGRLNPKSVKILNKFNFKWNDA